MSSSVRVENIEERRTRKSVGPLIQDRWSVTTLEIAYAYTYSFIFPEPSHDSSHRH